jgi:FAD/FMN-containing dehydrogenase
MAWNLVADQRPVFVAEPRTAGDIAAVVRFARQEGLRVAPQGTGHNATARAGVDGSILLNTRQMRGVEIDFERRSARIEAGALCADLTAPASELGLAALAGSSPDVGLVGYTLGGGMGWLARAFGLCCNSACPSTSSPAAASSCTSTPSTIRSCSGHCAAARAARRSSRTWSWR